MKIVVIIPTYNEAKNIGRMLDVLVKEEFPKIKKHQMKALVVDSKSPDGTSRMVREKMKKSDQISLLEMGKEGLGAAYARGMKHAMHAMHADAIVELDADFQHDPKDVKRLIEAMDNGADYVIGSRYISGGAIPKEWGIHRKVISFFGSLFARIVLLKFNLHDLTSGLKLTKTEFLKKVDLNNLYSKYYAYKIHILNDVVKAGAKTVEIPILFYERKEGTSKITRKDLIDSFIVVTRLRLRDSKRFIKFGLVGLIGYSINALGLKYFTQLPLTTSLAASFHFWNDHWPLIITTQPSAWAAAMAAELAIVSNFTLNNFWTFQGKSITNPLRFLWKFLHFNITSIGAVIIQFLVVGYAVIFFGDKELVRQLALVVAVGLFIVPYNYTMYNIFIWKTWKVPGLRWLQNRNTQN